VMRGREPSRASTPWELRRGASAWKGLAIAARGEGRAGDGRRAPGPLEARARRLPRRPVLSFRVPLGAAPGALGTRWRARRGSTPTGSDEARRRRPGPS
jgi:hypothetical protein